MFNVDCFCEYRMIWEDKERMASLGEPTRQSDKPPAEKKLEQEISEKIGTYRADEPPEENIL